MSWWMAIPAALSAAGTISGNISANKQNESQLAWNNYNSTMQHQTDLANIANRSDLATMNASMTMAGANINAGAIMAAADVNAKSIMESAGISVNMASQVAAYNIGITKESALYNDSLLEEELAKTWDAMDLDLTLMENQRMVERGGIEAEQAASGVLMGQDSHAQVIISQQTQAELDALVVRHNADIKAGDISNARSKGIWEAQMAMTKIAWEGKMSNYATLENARIQSNTLKAQAQINAGTTLIQGAMSAAGTLISDRISAKADTQSALYGYQSNIASGQQQYDFNSQTISNHLVSGLFSSAGAGVSAYYSNKMPTSKTTGTNIPGTSSATNATFGQSFTQAGNSAQSRVYGGQMVTPGGSLLA